MLFQEKTWCAACLIPLLEKRRESMDRGLEFGILLTDLSKTFDCVPHDLFVSKQFTCGFDDYLRHRKQRTKVADS